MTPEARERKRARDRAREAAAREARLQPTPREAVRDWREAAACAQVDPELFFPNKGQDPRPAVRICAGCAVAEHCLAFVERLPLDEYGVWGGTTARERERRRRERQRSA